MTAREQLTIEAVAASAEPAVLDLAAQVWPPADRAGQISTIIQRAAAGEAADFLLLAARRGTRLVGAALAQQLPGRAAVVWPPQLIAGERPATALALLDDLAQRLTEAGIHIAQSLLVDPTGSVADTLTSAGFVHAGDLLYMAAPAACFPAAAPQLPLDLAPYSPANHDRLLGIVETTYRGSLDCPLIDGLRDTADVLAGYRAVGHFRTELWLLARAEGREAGCLLLADHPADEQLEIVYLGVVPEFRGRGFGLALTRQAQWLAHREHRRRLVLAVDAANHPAIAAYLAAGFIAWDRRSVLVRNFRSAAKQSSAVT